jgi:hypothetical protein
MQFHVQICIFRKQALFNRYCTDVQEKGSDKMQRNNSNSVKTPCTRLKISLKNFF